MKTFLDIGAHLGQSATVALEPRWGFDRVVCVEPASACWPVIASITDPRVELHRCGLAGEDTQRTLFNPGQVGASVALDKGGAQDGSELCSFTDAARWLAEHTDPSEQIFAKINAEGGEADIVQRLHEEGLLARIDHLLIHFDVRKVPSLRHREPEIRRRLDEAGIDYIDADKIQFGGVYRGTRNWLRWAQAAPRTRDLRYMTLKKIEHRARVAMYRFKATQG